jgi:cell division protein FtsW (lipid II flippase)
VTLRHRLLASLMPGVGWLSLAAAIALTVIGILAIQMVDPGAAKKQMIFVPVALFAMLLVMLPHYRRYVDIAYPAFVVVLVLLVILLLPFMPESIVPTRNGARRWFDLQIGTLFQPSELMKIAYVIALAHYLRYRRNYRTVVGLLAPLLITFVPMALILVEPDLGTATIFMPVLFAMLIAAGARLKHIAAIVLIGAVLMPAMYPLLQPHQKQRIVAMISQIKGDPQYRSSIGFQGYKAQTLVGAGQLAGHDREHARVLVDYNALPEPQNDMVFAVICTRAGLLGGVVVVGFYLLFMAGALLAAALNKDPFARLVAVGISAVVFTQMFVNTGMTVGVLPITGMTLPFVSYGGSSLVANFIMVGLVLNVAASRPIIMANPSFEFDRPREQPTQRDPFGKAY